MCINAVFFCKYNFVLIYNIFLKVVRCCNLGFFVFLHVCSILIQPCCVRGVASNFAVNAVFLPGLCLAYFFHQITLTLITDTDHWKNDNFGLWENLLNSILNIEPDMVRNGKFLQPQSVLCTSGGFTCLDNSLKIKKSNYSVEKKKSDNSLKIRKHHNFLNFFSFQVIIFVLFLIYLNNLEGMTIFYFEHKIYS